MVRGYIRSEDDVAVMLAPVGKSRRILIASKGRELPRLVVPLGGIPNFLPGRGVVSALHGLIVAEQRKVVDQRAPFDACTKLQKRQQRGSLKYFASFLGGFIQRKIIARINAPEPFGMIGHRRKVQRPGKLNSFAACNRCALPFSNPIRGVQVKAIAHEIGINRQTAVDVKISEIEVLEQVGGLNLTRSPERSVKGFLILCGDRRCQRRLGFRALGLERNDV